jgi:hypothetical protein
MLLKEVIIVYCKNHTLYHHNKREKLKLLNDLLDGAIKEGYYINDDLRKDYVFIKACIQNSKLQSYRRNLIKCEKTNGKSDLVLVELLEVHAHTLLNAASHYS